MTPKETREYEQGKAYGYTHPHKVAGWFKSAAWNDGLIAGKAEYWKEYKIREKQLREYRKRERRRHETRIDDGPD